MIARLANEFFAALPGQPTAAFSPPGELDLGATPGPLRDLARCPTCRAKFCRSVSAECPFVPAAPDRLRLRRSGLWMRRTSGRLPLRSQVRLGSHRNQRFAAGVARSSAHFFEGVKAGPWAAAPVIPPASEMYSFPGFQRCFLHRQRLRQAEPIWRRRFRRGRCRDARSQPDLDGSRERSLCRGPTVPGANEMFSFPRVPGMSIPGSPPPPIVSPVPTTQRAAERSLYFRRSPHRVGESRSVVSSAPSEPSLRPPVRNNIRRSLPRPPSLQ